MPRTFTVTPGPKLAGRKIEKTSTDCPKCAAENHRTVGGDILRLFTVDGDPTPFCLGCGYITFTDIPSACGCGRPSSHSCHDPWVADAHQFGDFTTPIAVGDVVTFKPEFSDKLIGIEWIVSNRNGDIDVAANKELVAIKRKVNGRWGYRLAHLDDLAKVTR